MTLRESLPARQALGTENVLHPDVGGGGGVLLLSEGPHRAASPALPSTRGRRDLTPVSHIFSKILPLWSLLEVPHQLHLCHHIYKGPYVPEWHQRGAAPLLAASATGKPEWGVEVWTTRAGVTFRIRGGTLVTMDILRMAGWLSHWSVSQGLAARVTGFMWGHCPALSAKCLPTWLCFLPGS